MFARTPQPGLWFIAGSLAQCRIYSKYLALQIKACELGLLPQAHGTARETAPASATSGEIRECHTAAMTGSTHGASALDLALRSS